MHLPHNIEFNFSKNKKADLLAFLSVGILSITYVSGFFLSTPILLYVGLFCSISTGIMSAVV